MKKKMFIPAVAMLTLIVMALSTATWAWFTVRRNADLTLSTITATTGTELEISTNGSTWSKSVNLNLEFGNDKTTDISGDGVKFFKAKFTGTSTQPTGFEPVSSSMGNWVEFPLWFRAKDTMDVFLAENSAVTPVNDSQNGTSPRRSTYGNFSKDFIAGATRVAFLDENINTRSLIWAPNPEYGFKYIDGTETPNGIKLDKTVDKAAVYDEYEYVDSNTETPVGANIKKPFGSEITAQGTGGSFVNETGNFLVGPVLSPEAYNGAKEGYDVSSLGTIDVSDKNAGEWAEVKIYVRIWVEGTDPEAHEALAGGMFNTYLNFVGYEGQKGATPIADEFAVKTGTRVIEINNGEEGEGIEGFAIANYEISWSKNGAPTNAWQKITLLPTSEGDLVYDADGGDNGNGSITIAPNGAYVVYIRRARTDIGASSAIQFNFAKNVNTISAGVFSINDSDASEETKASLNEIRMNGAKMTDTELKSGAVYKYQYYTSKDVAWKDLKADTKFSGDITVYFREKETETTAASNVLTFTFTKEAQDAPEVLVAANNTATPTDIFIHMDTGVVTVEGGRAVEYRIGTTGAWLPLTSEKFGNGLYQFRFAGTDELLVSDFTEVDITTNDNDGLL